MRLNTPKKPSRSRDNQPQIKINNFWQSYFRDSTLKPINRISQVFLNIFLDGYLEQAFFVLLEPKNIKERLSLLSLTLFCLNRKDKNRGFTISLSTLVYLWNNAIVVSNRKRNSWFRRNLNSKFEHLIITAYKL